LSNQVPSKGWKCALPSRISIEVFRFHKLISESEGPVRDLA